MSKYEVHLKMRGNAKKMAFISKIEIIDIKQYIHVN